MNERCLLCKCTHKDASAVLKSIERSGDQQDRILQSRVQAQVMLHIRYGRLGGGGVHSRKDQSMAKALGGYGYTMSCL